MSAPVTEAPKLFGEWTFEEITVRDIGLQRYLNIEPIYLPHSSGRHTARKFRKSDMSRLRPKKYGRSDRNRDLTKYNIFSDRIYRMNRILLHENNIILIIL